MNNELAELREMCKNLHEKNSDLSQLVSYLEESLTRLYQIVTDIQTEQQLQRHYIMGLMDPNVDTGTFTSNHDRYFELLKKLMDARKADYEEHKKEQTSVKKHEKEFFDKLEAEKKAITDHISTL